MSTSSSGLWQPHDHLFRFALGSLRNAASLFRDFLPRDVVALADWNALRLENASFVDERYRRSESDLLFTAPVCAEDGERLKIYLLFEHQSTHDPEMPDRLYKYMGAIMDREKQQNPKQQGYTPPIPIVLAQVAGGWRVSTTFADRFKWTQATRQALERFVPNFEYLVLDLGQTPWDRLLGNVEVQVVLAAMKAVIDEDVPQSIAWVMVRLRRIRSTKLLEALLRYLVHVDSKMDLKKFEQKVSLAQNPNAEKAFMSIAEIIRRESEQKAEKAFKSVAESIRRESEQKAEKAFKSVAESIRRESEQKAEKAFKSAAESIRRESEQKAEKAFKSAAESIRRESEQKAEKAIKSAAESIRRESEKQGREEGEKRGLERGALIGQIRAYQRVLRQGVSAVGTLEASSERQLRAIVAKLERQIGSA